MTPDDLRAAVRTVADFPEPGIQFKDITPLLAAPSLLRYAVAELAAPFADAGLDAVVGIEARGFILGAMLADHLGVGFVPVRKAGKLPADTLAETYALEYGTDTVEMHADALAPAARVLVHDDVIATGGTAAAAARLVARAGADVVGYAFLVELAFLGGRDRLPAADTIHTLLDY